MRHFSGQIQTVGPNIRDVINIVSLMKIIQILFFSNVFFNQKGKTGHHITHIKGS